MKTRLLTLVAILAGMMVFFSTSCDKDETDETNGNNNTPNDTTQIPEGWNEVGNLNANNMIWALATDLEGNVYAAGGFTNSLGYCYVAKWDGASWQELGNLKANSTITAMIFDSNGDLYACGDFSNGITSGGGDKYVARWDGTQWEDIGGGGGGCLAADANGNIYKERYVWNGSSWEDICPACTTYLSSILSVATTPDGSAQYISGGIQHPNGARYVALCDATHCWTDLGNLNANADITVLALDQSGYLYTGGGFTNGALPSTGYHYIAKWDGISWSDLGHLNANGQIYFIAIDQVHHYVYASGYFSNAQGNYYVAKWDGTAWSDLGNMLLAPTPIHVDKDGKLYSVVAATQGGKFTVVVHQ